MSAPVSDVNQVPLSSYSHIHLISIIPAKHFYFYFLRTTCVFPMPNKLLSTTSSPREGCFFIEILLQKHPAIMSCTHSFPVKGGSTEVPLGGTTTEPDHKEEAMPPLVTKTEYFNCLLQFY